MTATKTRERDEAVTKLRELLAPGDTVYTVLRHVSSSGMSRWIDCYVIRDDEPLWISWWAAKATGNSVNTRNHEGVEMGGAGMDMGFALVYAISRAVFADGFDCISDPSSDRAPYDCPSNDHSNREHRQHHTEGGYALRHRWL